MKYLLLPLMLLSILLAILIPGEKVGPRKALEVMSLCGVPSMGDIVSDENGKYVVPLPGWGDYSYEITTAHDSAQYYFNQGLNMYYSYHMKEATASFKEASRFDPESPMTYWGQALSMGPYYNAAHTYAKPEGINEVLLAMNRNMGNASEKEKHLIKAMNSRYDTGKGGSAVKTADHAYALELKNLIRQYPDDQDIKVLYVDAVMLMHAWDFWNQDGTAKPWTPEVVDLCEKVIKQNPQHPAALHYHIHLTEASRHPEVALANADALKELLPGVPHMVHMASHEYQRNGLYSKGVEVNDLADENLVSYNKIAPNLSLVKHSPHYFAVQSYCALSGGMYKTGMQNALRCRNSVSPAYENTYDQYLFMIPVLTLVRLGKWQEILADSVIPDKRWPYARLLQHFAKGLAYVNSGRPDSAASQLAQVRIYQNDPALLKRRVPFNAPVQIAGVAAGILDASISFANKKYDSAFTSLKKAISEEDKLIYTEPNDWPIPARQFLGAYLLKAGRAAEAEKIYREDLEHNPGNGWSQLGIYNSLKMQKKHSNLAGYKTGYLKAFSAADEIPKHSVYINF
jgi:tetratricopeptide (TPR) repeat protein